MISPPLTLWCRDACFDSSEAANTSPSSFTSSSLSTPVVDKINGTDPDIKFVLDDVTLDSLLAEPMYDDKDVSDTSKSDSLFLSQSPSAPVVPLEAKLVREKRTAVVFDEENGDDAEATASLEEAETGRSWRIFWISGWIHKLADFPMVLFHICPLLSSQDPSDLKHFAVRVNTAARQKVVDARNGKRWVNWKLGTGLLNSSVPIFNCPLKTRFFEIWRACLLELNSFYYLLCSFFYLFFMNLIQCYLNALP